MSTPPEPRRRTFEPINSLPRPRAKPRDNHHLFWTRELMRQLELTDFRELRCAIVHQGDSVIHSLSHMRWAGVVLPDRTAEYDFRIRAQAALHRHDDAWCSCALPQRRLVVDALSLEPLAHDQPPCLGLSVDRDLLGLMRDHYRPLALVGPDLYRLLEERCRNQLCACPPARSWPQSA